MLTTYDEFIPLINQLNHNDKLRLAQWLINAIAIEEGVNDSKSFLGRTHVWHRVSHLTLTPNR